jgi:hypothetical protein
VSVQFPIGETKRDNIHVQLYSRKSLFISVVKYNESSIAQNEKVFSVEMRINKNAFKTCLTIESFINSTIVFARDGNSLQWKYTKEEFPKFFQEAKSLIQIVDLIQNLSPRLHDCKLRFESLSAINIIYKTGFIVRITFVQEWKIELTQSENMETSFLGKFEEFLQAQFAYSSIYAILTV